MTLSTLVFHWIPAEDGAIPFDAVQAGQEANETPLYIARVFELSQTYIGSVGRHLSGAVVSVNGEQRHYAQYDVLCASEPASLCWVDCSFDASDNRQWHESGVDGNGMCLGLPRKWTAVEVRQQGVSHPVYIGRTWFRGALRIGTVSTVEQGITFAMDGVHYHSREFAVLVLK
ncbi:hypothetical protein BDF22DRAFT_774276 [Syncephalis plumigaleata]|nr:hypothetical protein BDF22DRAFT_774276 [Syncephalis plumigaleata]